MPNHTRIHHRLKKLLPSLDRPGSFVVQGRLAMPLPGLDVVSIGTLAFPLPSAQAQDLITVCSRAPYGKGTKTVVDTDVRRVWELNPTDLRIGNAEWDFSLMLVVDTVKQTLGLHDVELRAKLYKLLVYEKGSFFLPHRDSEKQTGMVATCVLTLPSEHSGGDLIVRHDGKEEVVKFGLKKHRDMLQFAAFYSDCEHEVRPVKSGYRLSLIYNLVLANKSRKQIRAPQNEESIAKLTKALATWIDDEANDVLTPDADALGKTDDSSQESMPCLAISLEHQYTESGLALQTLKGADRAKFSALHSAAKGAGCRAFVGLVSLWEMGYAEPGFGYTYKSYGRYRDEYEGDHDPSEMEFMEVYESTLTASQMFDADGNRFPLDLPLEESWFLDPSAIRRVVTEQEYEGFTGNAGNTLDRWYKHAAVLIWPESCHDAILCRAGTAACVAEIAKRQKCIAKGAARKRERATAKLANFIEQVLTQWSPDWNDTDSVPEMAKTLINIGDPRLITDFIRRALVGRKHELRGTQLVKLCATAGWATCETAFGEVLAATDANSLVRNAKLLEAICCVRNKNAERIKACRTLTKQFVPQLEVLVKSSRTSTLSIMDALPSVVKAMVAGATKTVQSSFVKFLAEAAKPPKITPARPSHYRDVPFLSASPVHHFDMRITQVPAALQIAEWLAKRDVARDPIQKWLTACEKFLVASTKKAPIAPSNWKRSPIEICDCDDCRSVNDFLRDPNEESHRFPLAKARRQHLHQVIDRNQIDLTHVTERRGSPYVLVCTKTNKSHKRTLQEYKSDKKRLAELRRLLKSQ